MSLQYISDNTGKTTGIFIPINEWNALKEKCKGIDQEEFDIREWHKSMLEERMEKYRKNPDQTLDMDSAMDDIEKEFNAVNPSSECIKYRNIKN